MKRNNLLTSLKSSRLFHVAIVFLLASAIRMVYLYEIHDNPFFYNLTLDQTSYDHWAQRISAGQWLGKEIFYQDPLYPYFLGAVYSVIGRDLLWVRVIQLFIGSITCVLIYLLGTSFFGRSAGLTAGVVAAFYRPFFYFDAMILKTFLGVFLICLFILLILLARPRRSFFLWVGTGLVLGLLALVRANALFLAPGAIAWLFVTGREGEGFKYKLIASAGFAAGLFIVVATISARNYVVGREFVLLTSQAGQNFFIGNNPSNTSGRYHPPLYIRPNPKYEQEDFRVRAEIEGGRRLTSSEASSYWFGEAFGFIKHEPWKWLKLMTKKFWLFWNWYEVPDNQNYYFFSRYSFLLRQPLPDFRFVAALGLCGMLLCLPQWRNAFLLYMVVIVYSASVVAFYIFARYKLPVVPPLMVFAAFALTTMAGFIVRKKFLNLAGAALLALLFLVLLGTDVNKDDYYGDSANAFCRLGAVYQAEGKLDEALAAYDHATKILPYQWMSYYGLGEIYASRGETDLAIESYESAKLYNPGNPDIYARLGQLYYEKGRLDKSAELYIKASKLKPDWDKPHYWLARIYETQGNLREAQFHLRRLTELTMSSMPGD